MENESLATLLIFVVNIIVAGLVGFVSASFKIGQYKNKVDTLEKNSDKQEKGLQETRDKVIACETSLKEREPLTRKQSPVSLTDRGNKSLIDSGGKKFVDDNFEELKEKIEKRSPTTSYDVQELSKQAIEDLKNDSRITPLKEYLFKEGMVLDDLVIVLGIYLRDKILETKGWNVKEIDKYDPSNNS